jgi:hypothetical protein
MRCPLGEPLETPDLIPNSLGILAASVTAGHRIGLRLFFEPTINGMFGGL